MKPVLAIVVLCFLSSIALAQTEDAVSLDVDWESGSVTIEIVRTLPASVSDLPVAVSRARREVESAAPALIARELQTLQYDSLRTVEDLLTEDPGAITDLVSMAESARTIDSRASVDLRKVVVTFHLDLYSDLIGGFVKHDRAIDSPGRLGWVPTDAYTGILIYAGGELNVHGEGTTRTLEPALFPGVYYVTEDDAGVERLMEAGYVDPQHLSDWGPVMYTEDVSLPEFSSRIGTKPLRIIAYGAFGRYPTDVVIRYDDALQILATEHNRSLVTQGRVAIVMSPGSL